jgi:hypothetical protein
LTAAEGSVVTPITRPSVEVPPAGVATLTVNWNAGRHRRSVAEVD